MIELLSPAGSRASLEAAVQSGADAVYMGFGAFNARRSAKNFTDEEFASAVRYCHLRGVRVFLTLNTLLTDREREIAALIAQRLTNREIAEKLYLSEGSVKQYVNQLYAKLGIEGDTRTKRRRLAEQAKN